MRSITRLYRQQFQCRIVDSFVSFSGTHFPCSVKSFQYIKSRSICHVCPCRINKSIVLKGTKRELIKLREYISSNTSEYAYSSRYYSVDQGKDKSQLSDASRIIGPSKIKLDPKPQNPYNLNINATNQRLITDSTKKAVVPSTDKKDDDSIEDELNFDRNFITAVRALKEFLLKPEHLVGLRVTSRRSAQYNDIPLNVYWRKDVEAISLAVWGSKEAREKELEKRAKQKLDQQEFISFYTRYLTSGKSKKLNRKSWPVRGLRATSENDGLKSRSGKVVLWAIGINGGNMVLKLAAWVATGSHAMFSEFIHSSADTLNQVILAYGIKSSAKKADQHHPYGYTNMQYVSSLISGVGIFCMGAGLSVYHGIDGLISPIEIESVNIAFGILGISFVSESVTLALAVRSIRESAALANMGFLEYVLRGYDPCVNVVLLEDTAAVLGVLIAGASMGLSLQYGSPIPDALGSIAIGGLLGAVATFMITTNSNLLVGKNHLNPILQNSFTP